MQFTLVDPARLEREWPDFAGILAPALRQDPSQTLEGLRKRIAEGAEALLEITGPGRCLIVIEQADGVVWTKWLGGQIEGGPKARTAIMRRAVDHIETVAKAAGCTEHRLCGRDWARILPDYQPLEGHRNGLRKGL